MTKKQQIYLAATKRGALYPLASTQVGTCLPWFLLWFLLQVTVSVISVGIVSIIRGLARLGGWARRSFARLAWRSGSMAVSRVVIARRMGGALSRLARRSIARLARLTRGSRSGAVPRVVISRRMRGALSRLARRSIARLARLARRSRSVA